MDFFCFSYIYLKGNHCADKLVNIGLSAQQFTMFSYVHGDIREDFVRNKRGFLTLGLLLNGVLVYVPFTLLLLPSLLIIFWAALYYLFC